ncbi:hypothetical protein [Roseburia sp. MSJ-14]|uniref:hypothetical protein n=1 Tax=Roseburia sp. MSJ-14 TaxID=2841514 RepID=UPI001C10E092|nr:hypothetical protein [Roseburia sp. MSJ-14]MBU5473326.1 hypothetical protein [Roseburia sp. MSJ-14]
MKTVCVVYTCLVLGKVIFKNVTKRPDGQYGVNLLSMFFVACLGTAVLKSYKKLQGFPLIVVIIGQYILDIGVVLGSVSIADKWGLTQITTGGYRDLFFTVTVPYLMGAIFYYLFFFSEIRKANKILLDMHMIQKK